MLLNNLTIRIRREGFFPAVKEAAGTLLPTRLEVFRLAGKTAYKGNLIVSRDEVLVGGQAIEILKRFRHSSPGLPIEFYRDEIDQIQSCFLANINGQPAAIAWSYDHTKPAHFLRMTPGDAEIRSVYSLVQFRGRGLAKQVIGAACDSLFRNGFHAIYAVVHFRNEASLKAFRSMGFTKVADLRRPPLFGPRFVTATGRVETWMQAIARVFG